jgi:hypothetical protein
MKIIDTILQSRLFQEQPLVLVDIGASGSIHEKWKKIAPYAVCLAFDADDREFTVTEQESKVYKKLILFNRIVTATDQAATTFYLASSPFCSSLLPPQTALLQPWSFSSLFRTDRTLQLPAITLASALEQAGISYIDWFKTDTQGTDLRLFKSLPAAIRDTVLAAEFEPGIIDAYVGEDKLYSILQELPLMQFWLSSMDVKGTQRLHEKYLQQYGAFTAQRMVRKSPCWAELTYLREAAFTHERQALLLLVFALLERQYGFALEIIDKAQGQFGHIDFGPYRKAVEGQLSKEKIKVPLVILKKQFNKLLAHINA